ncbi:type I-F CRISPR-associated endoribonuclease Cas6/Csy4 [Marinobacter sp. 1-3A]|uniref:type I-F CRISPR-associated endoribonuclease Cas6/Csy4 n=1 Tax=Marinobacter sp. 1-3A TaxID=2582920 RepID=UPI0019082769|nr:type I-F CRISPR-associated endoribonuclease Cas6/Csy4 [Marinobacter sp. 1-3A]MBK1872880.1 type I-F CRISPR-associated endoribonuclease Cas6/Csy4 [Marinobacter sp. 1-3A]
MQVYQEITLLPEADISLGFLWQKLYQQIHIALVEHKVADNQSHVAVGFPGYGAKGFPLGRKLRLFAPERVQLERLNIESYLSRLSDYAHLKSIQPVPETTVYASFMRYHAKGAARIEKDHQEKARRWMLKSGKPLEDCLAELDKTRPEPASGLPFLWIESQETKKREGGQAQKFPMFIKKSEQSEVHKGLLTCYGLSHPGKPVALPVF